MHALSVPLYATRMSPDYTRPSRETLLAHFAEMGLSGDFWSL